MSGGVITDAVYNRLIAAAIGAPVYRNLPKADPTPPYVVIRGSDRGTRSLTLDGSLLEVSRVIEVIGSMTADSSDVDDLAETVATALHGQGILMTAPGYRIELANVDGPVELNPDTESYGRQLTLRLEVAKVL